MQQTFTVVGTTINANQSISGGVDLEGCSLIALEFPSAWTGGSQITFQAKSKNTLEANDVASDEGSEVWRNVYDSAGNELVVTVGSNRMVTDIPELAPFRYVRIRVGTSASPVNVNPGQNIKFIIKE